MEISAHTLSLQQTLKGVESKIAFLTQISQPHTPQQTEELRTYTALKQNLLKDIQSSLTSTQVQINQTIVPQANTTQNIAQQKIVHPHAPVIMSTAMTQIKPRNTTLTAPQQTHVVLTKPKQPITPYMPQTVSDVDGKILNKQRLQELIKEIDPTEQLDEDVEEMLMQIMDDFIEQVVSSSCGLAQHRKSNTLEVKDVKLHLEKQWNISIPGFGSDEIRTFKKPTPTDAHKQRLSLIRKALKK